MLNHAETNDHIKLLGTYRQLEYTCLTNEVPRTLTTVFVVRNDCVGEVASEYAGTGGKKNLSESTSAAAHLDNTFVFHQ